MRIASLLAAAPLLLHAAERFPEAAISNGLIKARVHLPDSQHGYYRGTRFDWAGVIPSLEYQGHQYFGVWFDHYDPKQHDAITGPVEEFYYKDAALGYEGAKAGGTFVRIGVGVLRKPGDGKFDRFHTYDIVDGGKWTVSAHANWVDFRHRLKDAASGYGYDYHKTVRLLAGQPEMVIEHTLKNTGGKLIETDVYNHNFFVIDGEQSGPNLKVVFPFEAKAVGDLQDKGEVTGRELRYRRELAHGESMMTDVEGFGPGVADHSFKVENRRSGAGVEVRGDRPMARLLFWSSWKVLSPENYVHMAVEPGREFKWTVRYRFYTLK